MKIAVVHDWLVTYAGAERVLQQMLRCFPNADLFSVIDFLSEQDRNLILGRRAITSFIQKIPAAKAHYRKMLPLMPRAIARLDLSEYDLILSSSHAVAKGVNKADSQIHISYVHTPMRYAWDLREQYLRETHMNKGLKGFVAHRLLNRLQKWDLANTEKVDRLIANSSFIASRIKANYGRDSVVIYPPVDVEAFSFRQQKEGFFLTASRFVPYKKIDLIVEAFSKMPEKCLVVIGDGPDFEKISARQSKNVELLGFQPTEVLMDYMQRASAFVFAAEEDFGITVVEAQACGTPVIAYGKGGALETVRGIDQPEPTGLFFEKQSSEAIIEAVHRFESNRDRIFAVACRKNALRFGSDRFRDEYKKFVDLAVAERAKGIVPSR